jgi:O-antigen ligase
MARMLIANRLSYLLPVAVLLSAALVDMPRRIELPSGSLLGILTFAQFAAVLVLWAWKASLPRRLWFMLPLLALLAYAGVSLLWSPLRQEGLQNVTVLGTFTLLVLLCAREVRADARIATAVSRVIEVTALLTTLAFVVVLVRAGGHAGSDTLIGARSFGLFAIVGIACQLSRWQSGKASGLWLAILMTGASFMSMSRMAFVSAALLFPLAAVLAGGRGQAVRAVLVTVLMGSALTAGVFFYEPMRSRFFAEDASLQVGGLAVNTSGRANVWREVSSSFAQAPWLGQGVGSATIYAQAYGIGHPHNDYLRVAHDTGLLGASLLVGGLLLILRHLWRQLRRETDADARAMHLAALLATAGVAITMVTDNSLSYIFVMAPLGILVGCSCGLAALCRAGRAGGESVPAGGPRWTVRSPQKRGDQCELCF